ncbi:MAG: NUDIX hydrolase N-terminal domain-containing protein [Bacillota bacterium]
MDPKWLEWARRLQAIAQNGLTYARDPFDIQRYESVRNIATEIVSVHSNIEVERVADIFAGEVGYATLKVDVRGAVFQDDTITASSVPNQRIAFTISLPASPALTARGR